MAQKIIPFATKENGGLRFTSMESAAEELQTLLSGHNYLGHVAVHVETREGVGFEEFAEGYLFIVEETE